MERRFLGIDIGGTNLRGRLVSGEGKTLAEKEARSGAGEGVGRLMDNLADLVKDLGAGGLSAVGIGVPGTVERENGILAQAPNIAGVKDFPFTAALSEKIGDSAPVFVENDASLAALAEHRDGAGRGYGSMIMITLGTGFGGGIILDGKLWSGEDGFAGELGHITIDPSGPECGCGSNGCVETYVSLVAIKRIVRQYPGLREKLENVEKAEIPRRLEELAAEGDGDSVRIWNEFGKNLGVGISVLVNILNVNTVVVGGGLSNAWELFREETEREAAKRTLAASARNLRIKKAALGEDAGVLGACHLARSGFGENS